MIFLQQAPAKSRQIEKNRWISINEKIALNRKAILRWLALVSPKGFEPPSSEPETIDMGLFSTFRKLQLFSQKPPNFAKNAYFCKSQTRFFVKFRTQN